MRRLLVLGLLLLAATGCSEPPQKEIDQAAAAVDLARAAGADKFAADEYTAATAGVQKARDAVDQRDYRQALSYAIDARQRAQNAMRLAAEARASVQRATEALIADLTARANQLQTRLKPGDATRAPVKELRTLRAAVADAQTGLQEARTEIGAGNYDKAGEILMAVRKKLDAAAQDAERILPRPSRTGRGDAKQPPSRR